MSRKSASARVETNARKSKRTIARAKPKRDRRTRPLPKLEGALAPDDPLLTIGEAASFLRTSVSALYKANMTFDPAKPERYIPKGPKVTKIGGRIRYLKSHLIAFRDAEAPTLINPWPEK